MAHVGGHQSFDFWQASVARGGPGKDEGFLTFCDRNEQAFTERRPFCLSMHGEECGAAQSLSQKVSDACAWRRAGLYKRDSDATIQLKAGGETGLLFVYEGTARPVQWVHGDTESFQIQWPDKQWDKSMFRPAADSSQDLVRNDSDRSEGCLRDVVRRGGVSLGPRRASNWAPRAEPTKNIA